MDGIGSAKRMFGAIYLTHFNITESHRYQCEALPAMKMIVPVVTAVVLALALVPASAAPKHHKRHTNAAAQPQIACTVVGCMPVPRGCHPEMGYTPDGTPTGFDVAVCPNYTLYGNHR